MISDNHKEGEMKKVLSIMEGFAINIVSMAFGFFAVYLFYFLFVYPGTVIIQEII